MRRSRLLEAIRQADRFLVFANAVENAEGNGYDAGDDIFFYPSRDTGTVRRASMDLSNALADLRKAD